MQRAVLVVALGVSLGACNGSSITGTPGSGNLATESRPVSGFTGVSVGGAGHLIVEQTGVESLEITAEDNLLPLIRSEVVNGTLVLGFTPGTNVQSSHQVLYRLTVRDLVGLEASGASRVEIPNLTTSHLGTVLSGASELTAGGVAGNHARVLSGASRCEAPDLQSRVVTATLSGASYALVRVSDTLTTVASGGSSLEYYGSPITVVDLSGGSTVRRVGP